MFVESQIDFLLEMALDKIAYLPFAYSVDLVSSFSYKNNFIQLNNDFDLIIISIYNKNKIIHLNEIFGQLNAV